MNDRFARDFRESNWLCQPAGSYAVGAGAVEVIEFLRESEATTSQSQG